MGEPLILASQFLNKASQHDKALELALRAESLLARWGTAWDKRVSLAGWLSMARIQQRLAREKTFPKKPLDFINLGKI